MTIEIFNASGTWTCPEGVTEVTVECWGGGAGGQSGAFFDAPDPDEHYGGRGGGGGAYVRSVLAVTPSTVYTVTVGAGGTGGVYAAESFPVQGTNGGDSWFNTSGTVNADGGMSTGNGGTTAASTGDVKFQGGAGGTSPTLYQNGGSGGGSSAGTAANGGNGSTTGTNTGGAGGTAPSGGGGGGAGGSTPGNPGNAGTAPGGGGGGGAAGTLVSTGNGGAGAAGRVQLTHSGPEPTPGPRSRRGDANLLPVDASVVRSHGALFRTGLEPPADNATLRRTRVGGAEIAHVEAHARRTHGALFRTGLEPPPVLQPRRDAQAELAPVEARTTRQLPPHADPLASTVQGRRRVAIAPDVNVEAHAQRCSPHLIDWAKRYHEARGLYRVFNATEYRFYRSSVGPPVEGDAPFGTSSSIDATPEVTFADGTWWLSVSYFNGAIDSGFLPIGASGSTALVLVVDAGEEGSVPPLAPIDVRIELRAGGVVRIHALYVEAGARRATAWAVGYTVDGSTPPEGAPTVTQAFRSTVGLEVLSIDVPAQAHGTTIKVRTQVRRGADVYSLDSAVLTAIADATGPAAPDVGQSWPGPLPEEA